MEVFVAQRRAQDAVELVERLKQLGLRGRDAGYLASTLPPGGEDVAVVENFIAEFKLMVAPEARDEAARLIDLRNW